MRPIQYQFTHEQHFQLQLVSETFSKYSISYKVAIGLLFYMRANRSLGSLLKSI